jgi:hypothetical protein
MAEGRLSRWSRLKSKGGAEEREEKTALKDREVEQIARATAEPETLKLPGGARVRNFVPAMPPLAPNVEDDDDRLTRGIGHLAPLEGDDVQASATMEPLDALDQARPEGADVSLSDDLLNDIEDEDLESLSDEERESVAGLPPLDSITAESDMTPFMQQGVPDFLKRKALRLVWRRDPFFNIRDGLNDYDDDFNVIHKLIDSFVGNYKVGRGHLSEQELKDMTPPEARKVFYPEDEEDVIVDGEDAEGDDDSKPKDAAESTEPEAETVDIVDDEDAIGDGEDEGV